VPKAKSLAALSPAELVDKLGATRAQLSELETAEKAVRAELLKRRIGEATGKLFRGVLVSTSRLSLDTAALKREFGETWYEARCRNQLVTSFKVTPIAAAILRAAA
jgi:hypothetical protein